MEQAPLDFEPAKEPIWVTIRSFYYETQVALFVAKLEDAGIPTFVANSLAGSAIPLGEGGFKLQVPDVVLADAKAILEEIDSAERNPEEANFREASLEDIAYQKALHEQENGTYNWIRGILILAIILILLRMLFRAMGLIPNWMDPF